MAVRVLCISTDHDLPEAQLLCHLQDRGYHITSVIDPSSKHIELFRQHQISVHPRRIAGNIDLQSIRFVRELIAEQRIDIVHTFSKKALCTANLAAMGKPVRIIGYRGIVGNLSVFNPTAWLSFLHPKVDKVVCVCRAVENYLRTTRMKKTVPLTIHKGHNVEWYQKMPTGDLSEFGIPPGSTVLCCTANLRPRKGVHVLLDSLRHIPQELNVHVLLIGHVGKGVEIKQGEFAERIHLAGFREDAVSLVKACKLFVMPSLRREGLPKAVIEAMSVGTVPIVTTSGGMPEIVVDRECGRVIAPGDAKNLADCIVELVTDSKLRERYSKNAIRRIEEHFNISDTVANYESLYRSLLPENSLAEARASGNL